MEHLPVMDAELSALRDRMAQIESGCKECRTERRDIERQLFDKLDRLTMWMLAAVTSAFLAFLSSLGSGVLLYLMGRGGKP
jgi:hypothetical protein